MIFVYMHPTDTVGKCRYTDPPAVRAKEAAKYSLSAKQKAIAADNFRLVFKAIKRYPANWFNREEAESEAMYVLVRAAKGYKPILKGKPIRFSTYFYQCWVNHIKRSNEIAYCDKHGHQRNAGSLQSLTGFASHAEPRTSADAVPLALESRERAKELHAAMNRLHAREQQVLCWRMEGVTLQAIGEKLGVTRERARQIETNAFRHIRKIYEGLDPNKPRQDWRKPK